MSARLDLVLGGAPDALLALLGLRADPLRLGLQGLLGAGPGLLRGLAFDLLDQLADPLLGLAAHVLGALHHPLLDLGLELDRELVRLLGRRLGFGGALLGGGDALVGLELCLLERLLVAPLGLLFGLPDLDLDRFLGLRP